MFFYYPEEDSVLGQHETNLNETNIEEIRDVIANCFCFCHIINSLLTELVRSVQEDTADLVLFSLVCGPRLRLGLKKRKKNSSVQYPPVRTSRSVNNIYITPIYTVHVCHLTTCTQNTSHWMQTFFSNYNRFTL